MPLTQWRFAIALSSAAHKGDRQVVDHPSKYLKAAISQTEAAGEMKVEIPRAKDCSGRIATLTIRYATLTIIAPSNSKLEPVTVNVIWACEDNPKR